MQFGLAGVGSVNNPAELVIGENTAVLEEGSNGYYYTWTAEETSVLTITMPEGDWTYVINNITVGTYGDTQWSDSNPVNPAVINVAAGDKIQIMVNTYNPNDMWRNPAGELTITAEVMIPVACIDDVYYGTVKEALEAAANGDTVTMIADSHEEDSNLTIDEGVTLNVGSYDLYARSLNGLTGCTLIGTEYRGTNTDHGRIYLPASTRMVLSGMVIVNTNGDNRDLFPVWDTVNNCYIFGGGRFPTSQYELTISKDTINFYFTPSLKGELRRDYFADANEMSDNGLKIVLRLTWPSKDGNAISQQDFVYASNFVYGYTSTGSGKFTFALSGYDALNIEPDDLVVNIMFVADNGMIMRTPDITYTAE